MTIKEFRTSNDLRIPLIADYEDRIYVGKRDIRASLADDDWAYRKVGAKVRVERVSLDYYDFCLLYSLLGELRAIPDSGFRSGLDIGGREGTHAAQMRTRCVDRVSSIDMVDGNDDELDRRIFRQFRAVDRLSSLRKNALLQALSKMPFGTRLLNSWIYRDGATREYEQSLRLTEQWAEHVDLPTWEGEGRRRHATVDRFIVGSVYETPLDKHDLIFSFRTVNALDHRRLFRIVADSLEPGGIFAFHTVYLWGPLFRSGLTGDMPGFDRRLSLDDIEAYYRMHKPEQAPHVRDMYGMLDPSRPSLRTYADAADEFGMDLIGYKRLHIAPMTFVKAKQKGEKIFEDTAYWRSIGVDPLEILREIRGRRPDVQMEDLDTAGIMLVFKRRMGGQ
jgi:SAM-dependent methyltransferase